MPPICLVDRRAWSLHTIAAMTGDRRSQPRVTGPFEATWSGTSGHRRVRIADFSLTGCFVEDIAAPVMGERVTLTLLVSGGGPIEATGRVVYVNSPLGFAVAFDVNDRLVSELAAAARRVAQQRR
jgi:hypothetical protein